MYKKKMDPGQAAALIVSTRTSLSVSYSHCAVTTEPRAQRDKIQSGQSEVGRHSQTLLPLLCDRLGESTSGAASCFHCERATKPLSAAANFADLYSDAL